MIHCCRVVVKQVVSEIRQPLSDIIELYCRGVAESLIADDVNLMSTLTAAIVTDVMHAQQQACLSRRSTQR